MAKWSVVWVVWVCNDVIVCEQNSVTEQLQVRYAAEQIYTYVGDILIAVNPFRDMDIYTSEVCVCVWERGRDHGCP